MNAIRYRKGYKYQLAEDYHSTTRLRPDHVIDTRYIGLHPDGNLTVRSGYAWDGASGPTIDTKNCLRGSLAHDVKYQLIRSGLLSYCSKVIADEELHEDLLADGMNKWRAWVWWYSVDAFGRRSLSPSDEPMLWVAP